MTDTRPICEAMAMLADYAEVRGWMPIGVRTFTVGDFEVLVNGSRQDVDHVPPYHARADNTRYVGTMLFSAYGGSVIGYQHTERDFLEQLRAALAVVQVGRA